MVSPSMKTIKAANAKDAKRKAAEKELQMFCNQTGRHPIGRYFFLQRQQKIRCKKQRIFPILHAGGRFAADADIRHFCTNSKTAENA